MKGTAIKDLQTPSLLVDLDLMEANLEKMATFFKDKPCKLRPHFKNTKCIALAKKQLAAGAIGITTATLAETEALVNEGISSILIANEIAGEANLKKLVGLAEEKEIILAVDNERVVDEITGLLAGKKTKLSLVVDIDLGLKRCGVQPGLAALQLTKKIISKQLTFRGLMGYEGHLQRLNLIEENLLIRRQAMQQLIDTKNLLLSSGISVSIISAGGTGSYAVAGTMHSITEVQAGNYLLMDTSYAPFAPDFKPSLSLLTNVISVTPDERFVLNAGIKEISSERGMPSLKNFNAAVLTALHAEHGIAEIQNRSLEINAGDAVELNVYYSDGTVNLHRKMFGIRDGIVEEVFTIG